MTGSRTSRAVFEGAVRELLATVGGTTPSAAIGFRARQPALDTPYRAAEAAAAALAAGGAVARHLVGSSRPLSLDSRHAEASLLSFAYLRFLDPDKGLGPRIAGEERTQ